MLAALLIVAATSSAISSAVVPAASPTPAPTSTPRREFVAPTLDGDITVDGRLDEPQWAKAAVLDGFTNRRPVEGAAPSETTTVRIWRNATHLFVAFEAHDDAPSKVRATLSDRDAGSADDWVGLMIDPFETGRTAVFLVSNPLGIQTDCLEAENANDDCVWDTIFYTAGHVTDDGYVVEFSIPFASLTLDPDRDSWGISPLRAIARTGEQAWWSPIHQSAGNPLVQLGHMDGMRGIEVGATVQVIPEITARSGPGAVGGTGLARLSPPSGISRGASQGDVGVTARISRGGIGADIAINPDFSQVESDTTKVTINQRFPLSYDEKRPLFLEGREYFANLPWNVVYTRSIVDPIYGVKMTGREGPTSFAILNALDEHPAASTVDPAWNPDAYHGQPALTSVVRAVTEESDQVSVGIVATDKHVSNASSRLVGPDVAWRITKSWETVAQLLWSATDDPDGGYGEGSAVKWRLYRNGLHWSWFSWFEQTDRNFRAEAGFIPRVGYRETGIQTDYKVFTGREHGLVSVDSGIWARALDSLVNDDQNREVTPFFFLDFSHSNVQVIPGWYHERFVHENFDKRRVEVDVNSSWLRWLQTNIALSGGDEISYFQPTDPYLGTNFVANVSATLKPMERVTIGTTYYRELYSKAHSLAPADFRAQGVYDATVARVNAQVFFTPTISARVIEQWSTVEWKLAHSLLLAWRPGPGTIFYVGYTDASPGNHGIDVKPDRAVFVKLSYLWTR